MAWAPSPYSVLGIAAAAISTVVAGQAWRNRAERGAPAFTVLLLALAGWSASYAIQLGFSTAGEQVLWQQLGLTIGGTIPVLWLVFTLQYAGWDDWVRPATLGVLALEPVAFTGLAVTNGAHGLVWTGTSFVEVAGGAGVLRPAFAIGYQIHIAFAYLVIAAGLGLLVHVLVTASPIYRRQTGLLIASALPPFAANAAYTLGLELGPLTGIDPTPFVFAITGVLVGVALFEFDLLHRTPIAREQVLDEMGDGLIVLDVDGVVVNANALAERALTPAPEVGESIMESLPDDVTSLAEARDTLDGRTITSTVANRERAYDVDWSSLTEGETVGHVIALRDVTDRNQYEQRLDVAQRVLRHNLRNDMNVIQAWAEHLQHGEDGHEDAAARISETAAELIDLSEKTQTMVDLDAGATAPRVDVSVRETVRPIVDEFADRHPSATIECELPDARIPLPDPEFLAIPVRNLIENAIEHNEGTPWVQVRGECDSELTWIHVADDGPPIPAMERAVLAAGSEESLQHGSGVGLWLTYWSVQSAGGRISFDDREPRGNVVTLEYPRTGG